MISYGQWEPREFWRVEHDIEAQVTTSELYRADGRVVSISCWPWARTARIDPTLARYIEVGDEVSPGVAVASVDRDAERIDLTRRPWRFRLRWEWIRLAGRPLKREVRPLETP